MIRCLRCFEEYPDIFGVCPVCGNSVGCLSADPERLKPGCLLHGRYIVGYGVGRGGFGSVYRGYDKLTGTVTAIKELFVPSLVERSRDGITVGLRSSRFAPAWKAGIRRFFGEAEAEMSAPASVGCAVYDCFEENGTASGRNLELFDMADRIVITSMPDAGSAGRISQALSAVARLDAIRNTRNLVKMRAVFRGDGFEAPKELPSGASGIAEWLGAGAGRLSVRLSATGGWFDAIG